MTVPSESFSFGVIEGFFGQPWSWQDRRDYAAFLHDHEFSFYIYAPKADDVLRKDWRQSWSKTDWKAIAELRGSYAEKNVKFGLGLSPYELQRGYTVDGARDLKAKIRELNALEPDILAILFDDIPYVSTELAGVQTTIVEDALEVSRSAAHIVCPTYYSDDDVLTDALGAAPDDYLQDFGETLPPQVDVFWTGAKVCSAAYTQDHLRDVAARLGRKPFIWDNYPVNDGPRMCKHLHLRAIGGREHLSSDSAGVAFNPMNQAWLSMIPLVALARSLVERGRYEPETAFDAAAKEIVGSRLAGLLREDLSAFHDAGLSTFSTATRLEFARRYADYDTPLTKELLRWLEGGYELSAELVAEFEDFGQQSET